MIFTEKLKACGFYLECSTFRFHTTREKAHGIQPNLTLSGNPYRDRALCKSLVPYASAKIVSGLAAVALTHNSPKYLKWNLA